MTDYIEYPITIRDVTPGEGAVHLTGKSPNGLPSGVHTGGAWLFEDEVWKPCDGRPYANCEHHYSTHEHEILQALEGQPLFPKNWRFEQKNGRNWIVRQKAFIIPDDMSYDDLDTKQIYEVENGIRTANRLHWEIGDDIALAIDRQYRLFVYDLSCAINRAGGVGCYAADEEWRIEKFFKECKRDRLLLLRSNARRQCHEPEFWKDYNAGFQHVYASFHRPFSTLWATLPQEHILRHTDHANWELEIPWTWIITREPIADDICKRYELQWGWAPIHLLSYHA